MECKPRNRLFLGKRRSLQQQKLFAALPAKEVKNAELSQTGSERQANGLPFCGLLNLGNTCFVNSVLQVLRHCPGLYRSVYRCRKRVPLHHNGNGSGTAPTKSKEKQSCEEMEVESGGPVTFDQKEGEGEENLSNKDMGSGQHLLFSQFHQLLCNMCVAEENGEGALSPADFVTELREEFPQFTPGMQQDAQEFLRVLLMSLQEACVGFSVGLLTADSNPSNGTCEVTRKPTELENGYSVYLLNNDGVYEPVAGDIRKRRFRSRSSSNLKCRKLTDFYSLQTSTTHCEGSPPIKITGGGESCDQNLATDRSRVLLKVGDVTTGPGPSPNKQQTRDSNLVTGLFQGTLVYQTSCQECQHSTRRKETFLDVSVPVVKEAEGTALPSSGSTGRSGQGCSSVGPYSLTWAVSQFATKEKLRGSNKYWCQSCRHFVEAERSVMFGELPPVLTFHLNRFAASSHGVVSKIRGNIAIPLSLCFGPWCSTGCANRDQLYELFAVVLHSGSSCHMGHYTTCVQAKRCQHNINKYNGLPAAGLQKTATAKLEPELERGGNQWVWFDDNATSVISEVELMEMMSPLSSGICTAYILFYTCIK